VQRDASLDQRPVSYKNIMLDDDGRLGCDRGGLGALTKITSVERHGAVGQHVDRMLEDA